MNYEGFERLKDNAKTEEARFGISSTNNKVETPNSGIN